MSNITSPDVPSWMRRAATSVKKHAQCMVYQPAKAQPRAIRIGSVDHAMGLGEAAEAAVDKLMDLTLVSIAPRHVRSAAPCTHWSWRPFRSLCR
ncbi:hypothetical protein FOA52_010782 [Chlamydomonas sp. UWO 241]|nr:hypothetical protein FOA52_010782 [Chlamydomonas sp. UWO 241]